MIKGQDYNQEYYYLFDISNNTIDTLIGFPVIYDDKILCLESTYTDSPDYIELWEIENKRIILQSKFSLNTCKIRPLEISLSRNKEIIIKDVKNNYWKVNLL